VRLALALAISRPTGTTIPTLQPVTVIVTAVDDVPTQPVLTVPPTVEKNATLNVSASATDADNATLTYNFRLLEGMTEWPPLPTLRASPRLIWESLTTKIQAMC
jgi:hypothetical protein